jgi:hypothetical protein
MMTQIENYWPTLPDPPDMPIIPGGGGGDGCCTIAGTGSPYGSVTPSCIGQIYTDISTPGGIWISTGTGPSDWRQYVG